MSDLSTWQEVICGFRVRAVLRADSASELLLATPSQGSSQHVAILRLREEAARQRVVASYFTSELPITMLRLQERLIDGPTAIRIPSILNTTRDSTGLPCIIFSCTGIETLTSLQNRLPKPMSEREVLRLGSALSHTMMAAHQLSITHGSISPDVILLSNQAALDCNDSFSLTGFGQSALLAQLAKATGAQKGLSQQRLAFVAPEDKESYSDTPAADVYGIGSVLYSLLSGATPSPGQTALKALDVQLSYLIEQMMSASPALRPSMRQVASELATLLASESLFKLEQRVSAELGEELSVVICNKTQRRGTLQSIRASSSSATFSAAATLMHSAAQLQAHAHTALAKIHSYGPFLQGGAYAFIDPPFTQTLATYLEQVDSLRAEAIQIVGQLAQGLTQLHLSGIAHLGVCPEHIAVVETAPIRVLLLPTPALPHELKSPTSQLQTIPNYYVAPEVGKGVPDAAADVYSLGILLQVLLHGVCSANAPTVRPILPLPPVRAQDSSQLGTGSLPETAAVMPSSSAVQAANAATMTLELQELMRKMTASSPALRPPMSEVAQMLPWLGLLFPLLNGAPLGGKYTLVRRISSGGMGVIFEAENNILNTRVVLKIPYPQFPRDRIRQEVRAALKANAQHPGIVRIFDCETFPNGAPYIVMEFLEGELLGQRIEAAKKQPLTIEQVRRIGRQVASALAAAHSVGVVHRDLKPDNIMLVPDPEVPGGERAKVFDFGIAKVVAEHEQKERQGLTSVGTFMGTYRYSAPEQQMNAAGVDGLADVYSLGAVLYEMLGGQLPVQHPLRPLAPPELMLLLSRMTMRLSIHRPSMTEVAQALRDRTTKTPTRTAVMLGILVTVICCCIGVLAFLGVHSYTRQGSDEQSVSAKQHAGRNAEKKGTRKHGAVTPPEEPTNVEQKIAEPEPHSTPLQEPTKEEPKAAPDAQAQRCAVAALRIQGPSEFSKPYEFISSMLAELDAPFVTGDRLEIQPQSQGEAQVKVYPRQWTSHQREVLRNSLRDRRLGQGRISVECRARR